MDEMVTENKKAADGVQVDQVSALQHEEEEAYDESDIEPKEGWFHRTFPALRWTPTSPKLLKDAEETFLSFVETKSKGWYVDIGPINGHPCRIWTRRFGDKVLQKTKNGGGGPLPLVMLHGMGAGIAFFCTNFDDLAADRPLYAIDLPGFARSSRPHFSSNHQEAEQQLVTSIEEWRKKVGLEKMCLLGHSFGGYLAASYSLKYPERISHLILADPWGFSEQPTELVRRNLPWWVRILFHVFRHFNPLATLRLSGPFGFKAIKRMRPDLIRKFETVFETKEENLTIIPNYMFHCNAHDPSGESAFHSLMSGFAWAKEPMFPRLSALNPDIPMTVLYGGTSWITSISRAAFVEVAKREHSYTRVEVIEGAGHHIYADNSQEFNKQVIKACELSDKIEMAGHE